MTIFGTNSINSISNNGIFTSGDEFWNLSIPELIEQSIIRKEAKLSVDGALIVSTGQHTGRSPDDKYIVDDNNSESQNIWWGKSNKSISRTKFSHIFEELRIYLQERDIFIADLYVGASQDHSMRIRVITEHAWQSLFSRDLFIRVQHSNGYSWDPGFSVYAFPSFLADPVAYEINSPTFIIIDFKTKFVLIGGTGYAGEIKKSIFSVMNFLLPMKKVLPMHCSANIGANRDVSLFFGLSGTGKTTLSSEPTRKLIGDDEHGWSDDGVFNLEGGCYAKTIRLDYEYEPAIWKAVNRFGSVIENVVLHEGTREIDFHADTVTENTRGAYPIEFIDQRVDSGNADHPKTIFFLTADAFGILPPISRLNINQALYYFLSGYTSKLAGTEVGLGIEPQATFSSCFAAPFLPLHPKIYADLLGEKINKYQSKIWLVNTGWTGGPYGIGNRISLPYSRRLIEAALLGEMDSVEFQEEPFFRLSIPVHCAGVPDKLLNPVETWESYDNYQKTALFLIGLFKKNFLPFSDLVSNDVKNAGP